ncbi:MAG: ATP-binding protein [Fluviicola sp.]|nr:ATP-binding protein [Fluviicola sp.]
METLSSIIQQGEHQQLDFKFQISDSKKIARTLCAFANTDGGRLLIGVKDNGKVAGVNPEEELHMIEAAAEMYCSPPLTFSKRVWKEDMKLVLEIQVEQSEQLPVMARDEENRWRAYVRRKDHTLLANKILLQIWKFNQSETIQPAKMGDEETQLLKLIATEGEVTLSKIYRISKLTKGKTDRLIALFVYWELLDMNMNELGTSYQISDSESTENA